MAVRKMNVLKTPHAVSWFTQEHSEPTFGMFSQFWKCSMLGRNYDETMCCILRSLVDGKTASLRLELTNGQIINVKRKL